MPFFKVPLMKMGYRLVQDSKRKFWLKPYGYGLLAFNQNDLTIRYKTVGAQNQPLLWTLQNCESETEEGFLDELKSFEAHCASSSGGASYRQYEGDLSFLTPEEEKLLLMEQVGIL